MQKRPPRRSQLTIANHYLHGELPAETAITMLRRSDPFGKFLAGEVALDRMTKDKSHAAPTWSRMALHDYQVVVSQTSGPWRDGYDHAGSRVRAQMRIAQIVAHTAMYRRTALPQRSTVEDNKLLKVAVKTVDNFHINPVSKVDSALEVKGAIGELAVLLLAQRFALREIGCDEWLPLQGSFSEDNAGDCLTDSGGYAWDLNVFTPAGDNGAPAPAYRLQIRSSNSEYNAPPAGPTLYIYPDLSLSSDERRLGEKIIASCNAEALSAESATKATAELDARTALLLDVLEH